MQDSVTVHTMGYKVERSYPVYKYNGVTNFADGSASPFVSQNGKVLIEFQFVRSKVVTYPRIFDGECALYITQTSEGETLRFLYKYGGTSENVTFKFKTLLDKKYKGHLFIDTVTHEVTLSINGVEETKTLSRDYQQISISTIGSRDASSRFWAGSLGVQIYDIGTAKNSRKLVIDNKLGALVDKRLDLGSEEALDIAAANSGAANTTYSGGVGHLIVNGGYAGFQVRNLIVGRTYLLSFELFDIFDKGAGFLQIQGKDGGTIKEVPIKSGDTSVVVNLDVTNPIIKRRQSSSHYDLKIRNISFKEIVAWPINQFNDNDVELI